MCTYGCVCCVVVYVWMEKNEVVDVRVEEKRDGGKKGRRCGCFQRNGFLIKVTFFSLKHEGIEGKSMAIGSHLKPN